MNFIFFGRLAKEKGFDLIVKSLGCIVEKTGELPGNISIFGSGELQDILLEAFSMSPFFEDCSKYTEEEKLEVIEVLNTDGLSEEKKIYFFGWQSQEMIRNVLKVSHFSLMPSRFLETFGLSALESLNEGIPVVGFRKGGLVPFVFDELAVPFSSDDKNIEALSSKLVEVVEKYSPENEDTQSFWSNISHESKQIADRYTEERWMEQVRSILPKDTKKILLASDYITLLGGIETHIQTIARALRQCGYEVEIFGWNLPKGRWNKLLRLAGLVYSLCNITALFSIRKKIREYEPDVIWLHSVSRFLGPLVVREVASWGKEKRFASEKNGKSPEKGGNLNENCVSKGAVRSSTANEERKIGVQSSHFAEISTLVTYHDLGLWSPFPSKVESEDMIPKTPSLSSFLATIHSNNPIVYLAAYCKYFQIYILRKNLQKIHIHIVPSAFLAPYVENISEVPKERIVALEHFL